MRAPRAGTTIFLYNEIHTVTCNKAQECAGANLSAGGSLLRRAPKVGGPKKISRSSLNRIHREIWFVTPFQQPSAEREPHRTEAGRVVRSRPTGFSLTRGCQWGGGTAAILAVSQ